LHLRTYRWPLAINGQRLERTCLGSLAAGFGQETGSAAPCRANHLVDELRNRPFDQTYTLSKQQPSINQAMRLWLVVLRDEETSPGSASAVAGRDRREAVKRTNHPQLHARLCSSRLIGNLQAAFTKLSLAREALKNS